MPRDLRRFVRQPFAGVINTARRETIQELQQSGALPPQVLVTPEPSNPEVLGLDGQPHERHALFFGLDDVGSSDTFLQDSGRIINYYRR